ncbi:hypothetical protein BC937DRAFT_87262 [Endogone sp. FLAS-F59071]|nr:hypothetical protein BC937DRAFT_87262 [Endogone sp. FLAS-F59071]|eukprot:RUS19571.1 hypothetical protein BC937DRAFT_87262 [Endogone sp. FLAS-F59071]
MMKQLNEYILRKAARDENGSSLDPLELGICTLKCILLPILKQSAPKAEPIVHAGFDFLGNKDVQHQMKGLARGVSDWFSKSE